MKLPYTISTDSVTIFIDGKMKAVSSDDASYPAVVEELKKPVHDKDKLIELMDKPKFLAKVTAGLVQVSEDMVTYKGAPIHDTLTIKLLAMMKEGYDIRPWARFLDNLMDNPSYKSREQLFNFLEKYKTPITDDGCFLAFKRVRDNFKDLYSGTFDNSPGKLVSMPRASVDDDGNRTCSAGLHACASDYLTKSGYGGSYGNKVVVVKINPRDVVSIPVDYNFSKMRVCQYLVLAETEERLMSSFEDTHYTNWDRQYDSSYDDDDEDEFNWTEDQLDFWWEDLLEDQDRLDISGYRSLEEADDWWYGQDHEDKHQDRVDWEAGY